MRPSRFFCLLGLLAAGACDFGTPIKGGGGTEGEGLTGIIVDEGGSPVVDAWVRAYSADDASVALAKSTTAARSAVSTATWSQPVDSALTNARGRFSLTRLAAGSYNLAASVQHGDTTLSVFIRGVVYGGGRQELGTDTLHAAGSASLQVFADDEPVIGAVCFVPGSPYRAITDAQGHCLLEGLAPGVFTISVSYPGYKTAVSDSTGVEAGLSSNCGGVVLSAAAPAKAAPDFP